MSRDGWLLDPETREPLPGVPSKEREIAYNAVHWRPGCNLEGCDCGSARWRER